MSRIDSISKALETEYGYDLSSGKFINVSEEAEVNIVEAESVQELMPVNNGPVQLVVGKTQEHIDDEDSVKRNMRELIAKGMELAEDMFEFVRISESPKSFEPAAAYLKTLAELNEKLLDVHERDDKRKGKGGDDSKGNVNNTQNNTIICKDPAEILKALNKK